MSSLLLLVLLVPKKVRSRGYKRSREGQVQVSDGKVERMPRARLLPGYMLCVESIHPLSGVPCPPFIDQGGAGITYGRKRKTQRERESFEGAGSSFSLEPALLTWQTVPEIACSLILIGPRHGLGQLVVMSHPTPMDDAACQGTEP